MSKELVVSAGRHETRVAILDDDQVVELFHEREKEYSLAGSIHKGRVTRVLPGMQSAFVDIGLERDAFLYVSDFFEDNEEFDAVVSVVEDKVLKMERGGTAPVALPEPAPDAAPDDAASVVAGAETGTAETAAITTLPGEQRQERQEGPRPEGGRPDSGRDDSRRERGGRGRRGRRRRGGRAGNGLPDSKFFSPRNEPARAPESETQTPAEADSPRDDDFFVLPGESLAKYSPDDDAIEENDAEPADAGLPAPVSVRPEFPSAAAPAPTVDVASALPVEHPLAGFGEIAA